MDLTARSLEECDIPAGLDLLRGHLAYPDDVLALLPRAWRRLLRDGALIATLIEQRRADGAPSAVGFGASVFVTDAWAAHARAGVEPYLSARTIRQELGGRSPILRPRAIARSHDAGGLNMLILHYGEAAALPLDARPALRYRMLQALIEAHRGYRIKDILQEFWDEIDEEFVVRGWGRVVTDYASFVRHHCETPPPGRRPHLIGITREEALAHPGNPAAPIFLYTPPRLSFTRAEQKMIGPALLGRTDVELARSLHIALATVKSRWRSIYNRVGRIAPELLPSVDPANVGSVSRGQEKRRRLLDYVRRHPEELRSAHCAPSTRQGRPRRRRAVIRK